MEYHKANTLAEAVALNAAYPDLPVLAGGTDLIVGWRSGLIAPKGFIDISSVEEIKTVEDVNGLLEIGAAATHAFIAKSDLVGERASLLSKACLSIGACQIQNRGTIGGNIMNASPAGDTLPVLLIYDAEFKLQTVKGERWVNAGDFFVSYKKTLKLPDELLTKIRIGRPDEKNENRVFYKIGTRRAQAISKVVMAIRGLIDHGGIRDLAIGVGSVAPVPMRAFGTEALLRGAMITAAVTDQAKRSIMDEFHPIDDVRSTSSYRSFVLGGLIERYLRSQ
jgi:carbon-monoxide dehydrogenase medium subunit